MPRSSHPTPPASKTHVFYPYFFTVFILFASGFKTDRLNSGILPEFRHSLRKMWRRHFFDLAFLQNMHQQNTLVEARRLMASRDHGGKESYHHITSVDRAKKNRKKSFSRKTEENDDNEYGKISTKIFANFIHLHFSTSTMRGRRGREGGIGARAIAFVRFVRPRKAHDGGV